MKSMVMSAFLTALLASAVAVPAVAAERERGINARQDAQQNRIQRGARQGDLTRGETRRLQGEVRTVRREERSFRSDGNLSAGERRHLNRDLNRVSRDIHQQRHDGQRRFGYQGYQGANQRFGYRGQGHAFGRHGSDRRFWGRGAERRFSSHGGHPRFGNQWGHPSKSRALSRIDRLQAKQHRRIVQGVRSGDLTRREAGRLRAEQRVIQRKERAYLADGRLSRGERRDLYRDLRSANRHIYKQTHDAQTRR